MQEKFRPQPIPTTETPIPKIETSKEDLLKELASKKTRDLLTSFIFSMKMNLLPADIEDVVQDSMIKAAKAIQNGKFDQSVTKLTSWLYEVAKNTALDLLRKKKYRKIMGPLPDRREFISKEPNSKQKYIAAEMANNLDSGIDQLTEEQREAVQLLAQGMKLKEIAEQMQIPLNTTKTRVRQARIFLKKWMEEKEEK